MIFPHSFFRYGRWNGNSYESSSEETIALLIFICILQVISMYPAQRGHHRRVGLQQKWLELARLSYQLSII